MLRGLKGRALAMSMAGAFCTGPAFAGDGDCYYFGYGLGDLNSVQIGRVSDRAARVNFLKGEASRKNCPDAGPACREKSYLVPGDEVVLMNRRNGFICASYVGPKGRITNGWLPGEAVVPVSDEHSPGDRDWIGTWRSGPEQTIRIGSGSTAGELTITGDATWGASDPDRVKRGAVNIGGLEGKAQVGGDSLAFGMGEDGSVPFEQADEADCKVRMRRLGPYLLVKDNGMCGGMNVTFTGAYRR